MRLTRSLFSNQYESMPNYEYIVCILYSEPGTYIKPILSLVSVNPILIHLISLCYISITLKNVPY